MFLLQEKYDNHPNVQETKRKMFELTVSTILKQSNQVHPNDNHYKADYFSWEISRPIRNVPFSSDGLIIKHSLTNTTDIERGLRRGMQIKTELESRQSE